MALKNLKSDLTEYFKKEVPKPTGRFQEPDRTMSDLDVHGKLETYKRPDIESDLSGNPIIPTNFDQPDTTKRYSDNFESKLLQLKSVNISPAGLTGRLETVHTSPVDVEPVQISGNNEESLTEHENTNPKGRFIESTVVIPKTTADGRFTVSNMDPILSVLKGRFETSDVKPIESVLEGYQVKTDGNGNELPSHIPIVKTTTFGIQNIEEEGPAVYDYAKAVKFNGSLVDINDSENHFFSERPIKSFGTIPGALTGTNLDPIGNSFVPSSNSNSAYTGTSLTSYSTSPNTIVNSQQTIYGNSISSDLIVQNIQYASPSSEEFWAPQVLTPYGVVSGELVSIDQPFRVGSLIVTATELYDRINTKYTTDFTTIGFVEPDGVTQHTLQDISAINVAPDTYQSQLVATPLNYIIPFDGTNPNSVIFNFGYDIISTAVGSGQGQTYTVLSTANSPLPHTLITGLKSGNIETLLANDGATEGLDMVQSYTVSAQNTIVPISQTTITGGKNSFDITTLEDSQIIKTSLFGGKTHHQIGRLDSIDTAKIIKLDDQIATGIYQFEESHRVGFNTNMQQNFSEGGEDGSNYIGIGEGKYGHPGIASTYSHRTIYQSAFGLDQTLADSNTGETTVIAYDADNHLTPGSLRQFTLNQTEPINYIQFNDSDQLQFAEVGGTSLQSSLSNQSGGMYIHRLGPYGMDTTVSSNALNASDEVRNQLPRLYNSGLGSQEYGIPLGKKPSDYLGNFNDNTMEIGTRYGDYITTQIRSGEDQQWYEAAFPMMLGSNISSAKVGVDQLKKMMKRKKTYRIWETHNSYTTQGNQGLHKGLEHFGIAAGAGGIADGWFPEVTNVTSAGNTTANRYYSVLGYPGLMVAHGLADSGALTHVDFRALINDPLAGFYGESTISNYSTNSMIARGGSYNQGRTGLMRRDYRQPTSKAKPYGGDAITQQSISGTNIKGMEQEYGDLIKFYIKDPIGNKTLRFRSYITAINDSVGATWTGVKYLGRPNNLFIYEGASDRKLSFSLKVAALSRYDVIHMWKKVNYLTSLCYPHVNNQTKQMIGPVVGLTLGDWFQDEPGFFDSVNITVDTSSPWEINLEDHRFKADGLGGELLDSALKGGISGVINTGLNKVKDYAKGKLLNKSIDSKGKQVAQLPHVIDITLGFTSMASSNRRVGGDMFGFLNEDGSWKNGEPGFPKPSALDKLMGGAAGTFAGSGVGKALGGIMGRF